MDQGRRLELFDLVAVEAAVHSAPITRSLRPRSDRASRLRSAAVELPERVEQLVLEQTVRSEQVQLLRCG